MPALTNNKHEIFARELAKGESQADAYKTAGYKPSEQHASRLASDGKVLARIAEIQQLAVIRTEITIDRITAMLLEDRELARSTKQSAAAVSATEKLGKLHGHFVDRTENVNTTYVVSSDPVDDAEQWAREHAPHH